MGQIPAPKFQEEALGKEANTGNVTNALAALREINDGGLDNIALAPEGNAFAVNNYGSFKCASPGCFFRPHAVVNEGGYCHMGGYCCIKCCWAKGNGHGQDCEKVRAKMDAPRARPDWRAEKGSEIWSILHGTGKH